MKNILVTGTVAFDQLFSYDAAFLDGLREATESGALSVSFQTQAYVKRNGGTGANISWNLSLLRKHPLLVADVGLDGGEYLRLLAARGIDISHVSIRRDAMTPAGVCCTDTQEHQIWFFHRGADAKGSWPNLSKDRPRIAYAIIGARHAPIMLQASRWCRAQGVPAILDPGQEILKFEKEDLREAVEGSTGIVANEFEWQVLSERLGMDTMQLVNKIEFLIVTRSENGHSVFTHKGQRDIARCDCEAFADPTGAGDAFRAGLLTGMTAGWSLDNASKLAAAVASFVVEQEGTLMESLDLKRVFARAEQTYGEPLPSLPTD